MLGRLIRGALILLLLAVAGAAAALVWMHLTVQGQRGPLPVAGELMDLSKQSDLPIRVSVIETAEQVTPRREVVDSTNDPTPDAAYVMTHPSFVLEWADGRLLLVDAGMTRDGAIKFGQPMETLIGSGPLTPLKTVASALGKDLARVKGIVFTHLHLDHVDGLRDICARLEKPVKVFMTGGQLDTWTLLTSEGKDVVLHSAGCTEPVRIGPANLIPLDGFPGVGVIHAAGHTPGSQIVVAAVRDQAGTLQRWVFSGDVTNTIDGIRHDLSKPLFYRLVVVPEDDDRLGELRRYLKALEDLKMTIVPSHDQNHLHTVGLPPWGS